MTFWMGRQEVVYDAFLPASMIGSEPATEKVTGIPNGTGGIFSCPEPALYKERRNALADKAIESGVLCCSLISFQSL